MNFLSNFLNYFFSNETIHQLVIPVIFKTFIVIATLIAVRVLIHFTNKGIDNFCKRKNINSHSCLIMKKAVRYSIRVFALVFVLQNIGVNVSALITALGISGVAISFGMKDTISNIIAGILIMIYQQFKIGDHIKIKDWQGKVIDINIRYTTIQTEDMTVFVPNSVLYSATMAIVHNKAN